MRNSKTKKITQIAITAALYTAITFVFQTIAFSPTQLRPSEALVVLVAFGGHYKYGLALGCFLANLLSSGNIIDVICGSLITLLSCIIAEKLYKKNKYTIFLTLPHVVCSGLLVPIYLHILFKLPYWVTVAQVTTSCLLNNLLLGSVLFPYVKKHERNL